MSTDVPGLWFRLDLCLRVVVQDLQVTGFGDLTLDHCSELWTPNADLARNVLYERVTNPRGMPRHIGVGHHAVINEEPEPLMARATNVRESELSDELPS